MLSFEAYPWEPTFDNAWTSISGNDWIQDPQAFLQTPHQHLPHAIPTTVLRGSGITTLIPGKIYLADKTSAASLALVKSHGITHAVNAANDTPNHHPGELVYYNPRLGDPMTEQLDIEGPLEFIESALSQGGRVMLFCNLGVSRSPTLAAAYLMRSQGVSSSEALQLVRASRPDVNPIPNHQQALVQFESRLRGQGPAVGQLPTATANVYLPNYFDGKTVTHTTGSPEVNEVPFPHTLAADLPQPVTVYSPPAHTYGYTQTYTSGLPAFSSSGYLPTYHPAGYVRTVRFSQAPFTAVYPSIFTTGQKQRHQRINVQRSFF